jgi:hypothetical protein
MSAGNIYHQLKGGLNRWVGRLINEADERLRTLEGTPSTFWQDMYRRVLCGLTTVGWWIQHSPRVDVWRWSSCGWSVVYAGSNYHLAEFRHALCSEAQSPTFAGRVGIWNLLTKASQWARDSELVVYELSRRQTRLSEGAYSFTIAPWVRMVLDVDRSPEAIMANMRKSIRKKLRKTLKNGFVCRYSQDQADFDLFYHKMFLPFLPRFQERAIAASYSDMLAEFQRGGLIILEYNDQPISGEMYLQAGNTLYGTWIGVLDGDYSLVRDYNVQFALHWFAIKLAQQMGCRYYDLGRALASMQNGMFYFKLSWGAQIRHDHRLHETWTFFSTNLSTDLRWHLNEQQFLTEINDEHYIVFLSDPRDSQDAALITERLDTARGQGLGGVLMVDRDFSGKKLMKS